MSEQENMQPPQADAEAQPSAANSEAGSGPESKAAPVLSGQFYLAMIVALAALGLAGWQWQDARSQIGGLQHELARRLSEAESFSRESRVLAAQAQEASRQAEIKVGLLESKLAESQNQQVALEALYQELSRNRDEAALAEVEQILMIASQQLQLAGNVKAALIAMQNADMRLQRIDKPQLAPLRKILAKDIERLKSIPYVDMVALSVRLDSVSRTVESLPLAADIRPESVSSGPPKGDSVAENIWIQMGREVWQDIKQLVRIQNTGKPEIPLLAPSQTYFLRENLRLRILGARLALLARDEVSYRNDLKAAETWILRYYDKNDKTTANVLSTLRQLYQSEISIELPGIDASLEAVRNYKLARERGIR